MAGRESGTCGGACRATVSARLAIGGRAAALVGGGLVHRIPEISAAPAEAHEGERYPASFLVPARFRPRTENPTNHRTGRFTATVPSAQRMGFPDSRGGNPDASRAGDAIAAAQREEPSQHVADETRLRGESLQLRSQLEARTRNAARREQVQGELSTAVDEASERLDAGRSGSADRIEQRLHSEHALRDELEHEIEDLNWLLELERRRVRTAEEEVDALRRRVDEADHAAAVARAAQRRAERALAEQLTTSRVLTRLGAEQAVARGAPAPSTKLASGKRAKPEGQGGGGRLARDQAQP